MQEIPSYLIAMIRRSVPRDCNVLPGSTPVVAFGDFRNARIATLGINPSNIEFEENGKFLRKSERRLATLESLGACDTSKFTDEQSEAVFNECVNYFNTGRHYGKWFKPLDHILKESFDVSYFDGTACHLDLVQWATKIKWGSLPEEVKEKLLREGVPFLKELLNNEKITHVIVNGRAVWNELERTGIVRANEVGTIAYGNKNTKASLMIGESNGISYLGWTTNIQSSPGANAHTLRDQLITWLKTNFQ